MKHLLILKINERLLICLYNLLMYFEIKVPEYFILVFIKLLIFLITSFTY